MNFDVALNKFWPNGDEYIKGLRAGMIQTAPEVFAKYGFDSQLVVAHFMAQISHECGAGHDVIENLNYSAQRMTQVWPSRFPTVASALPYAHDPQALANKVYNGRMGNKTGSNDGWNFRGRGASQTTGREGYTKLSAKVGLDLVNHPEIINDPKYFLECGAADFVLCGCLPWARKDNIYQVTKCLNGGTIGLAERTSWLNNKWKPANIKIPIASNPSPITITPNANAVAVNTGTTNTAAAPVSLWGKWFG